MQKINAKQRFNPGLRCVLLVFIVLWCTAVWAKEGIYFQRNDIHKIDAANNVYLVSAQIDYQLSAYLEQALLNGIVLNSSTRMLLVKPSSWWWNTAESLGTLDYQLKYHALSQQFLLTRPTHPMKSTLNTILAKHKP